LLREKEEQQVVQKRKKGATVHCQCRGSDENLETEGKYTTAKLSEGCICPKENLKKKQKTPFDRVGVLDCLQQSLQHSLHLQNE
jgi:hypothetical protein